MILFYDSVWFNKLQLHLTPSHPFSTNDSYIINFFSLKAKLTNDDYNHHAFLFKSSNKIRVNQPPIISLQEKCMRFQVKNQMKIFLKTECNELTKLFNLN